MTWVVSDKKNVHLSIEKKSRPPMVDVVIMFSIKLYFNAKIVYELSLSLAKIKWSHVMMDVVVGVEIARVFILFIFRSSKEKTAAAPFHRRLWMYNVYLHMDHRLQTHRRVLAASETSSFINSSYLPGKNKYKITKYSLKLFMSFQKSEESLVRDIRDICSILGIICDFFLSLMLSEK